MKNMKWVGLLAVVAVPLLSAYGQSPGAPAHGAPAQAQAAAPVNLSPGAAEVTRLASSGVGDDVVLAYIQNSQAPFNLSADDVLYLKDLGLSPQVTSAMLNHDNTLRGQPQQYAPSAPAPAAPQQYAPAPSTQPPLSPMANPPTAPAQVYAPAPAAAPTPVVAPPPAYVTTPPPDVTYFYNDLSPYGTWVNLEGYGWCWQPRAVVVSPGWRPYCDGGYWVYSDAGWYWQSSYSWGWAPFHYGRWYAHPRCGWVWTPDRVWGPAWVTWRVAGDTCGWAPLPPHSEFTVGMGWRFNGGAVGVNFGFGLGASAFAFVSFGNFCSHDLGHNCLPPARVKTVYNQTTIINNYTVVNNHTIVNHGIPIERVSAASHTPVPRATVHDWPAGRAQVAERSGSVVYRHPLPAPARPVNMVAQRVDTQHPAIQHAPVTSARTGRSSAYNGGAPATSRQSAKSVPNAAAWSSGAKPASSPHYQTPQRSYQPTSTTPAAAPRTSSWSSSGKPASSPQQYSAPRTYQPEPAPARVSDERKQGSSLTPSRSDTGSPARNNSRNVVQSKPTTGQSTSQKGNSPEYYPKGYYQAAELRRGSKSDRR